MLIKDLAEDLRLIAGRQQSRVSEHSSESEAGGGGYVASGELIPDVDVKAEHCPPHVVTLVVNRAEDAPDGVCCRHGYGPVDAQTCRELAAMLAAGSAAAWCLTLTGADGRAAAHACAGDGPAEGQPVLTWAAGLRARLKLLVAGVRPCAATWITPCRSTRAAGLANAI